MNALCMGYAPAPLIKQSLEIFTKEPFNGRKLFLDLSFPGNPNMNWVSKYGWECLKIENKGTAANLNKGWELLNHPEILVNVEPDEFAPNGWLTAAMNVIKDPTIACVNLMQEGTHKKIFAPVYNPQQYKINGQEVCEFPLALGWPMALYSARLLKHGTQNEHMYGFFETNTWKIARLNGLKIVYLWNYEAVHKTMDNFYEQWKHARGENKTTMSYEEWMKWRMDNEGLRGWPKNWSIAPLK